MNKTLEWARVLAFNEAKLQNLWNFPINATYRLLTLTLSFETTRARYLHLFEQFREHNSQWRVTHYKSSSYRTQSPTMCLRSSSLTSCYSAARWSFYAKNMAATLSSFASNRRITPFGTVLGRIGCGGGGQPARAVGSTFLRNLPPHDTVLRTEW